MSATIKYALDLADTYNQGATFDNTASAAAILTNALETAQNNAPIYLREGDIAQAMNCLENAQSFKEALAILAHDTTFDSLIDDLAHEAASSPKNNLQEPTPSQAKAGNYKKGKIGVFGLKISIENPCGSTRSGVSDDGKKWENVLRSHYGYIEKTKGNDGDEIDVFVKEGTSPDWSGQIYVINQVNPKTGEFDEHKCMIGFNDHDEAVANYLSNYDQGWMGLGQVDIVSLENFKIFLSGCSSVFDGVVFDKSDTQTIVAPLERITIVGQLADKSNQLQGGDFSGAHVLEKIKLADEVMTLLARLGVGGQSDDATDKTQDFEYDGDNITAGVRQARNDEAVALLKRIQSGEVVKPLSDEQRKTLSLYSGNGGGLKRESGKTGSQYEYYTPKPIAAGMWDLLKESGFAGGAVLDPCAGTGIFSATKPIDGVAIHSVELDAVSGGINKALFDDGVNTADVSNYEKIAAATDDEIYDAVITNVPFGDNKARGKSKVDDPRYQNESLDAYFILRSLDKLKPNGLAAFMSSTRFISGLAHEKARIAASMKAEFMGAYRLPNKLFESAGADVVTDVMVFKKHSRNALDRIEELKQTNPDALRSTGVLFDGFINGKYFGGEGLQFKIGESTTKINRFGKEVEALVTDASIADIAKSMKRFGGSRINWDLLDAQVGENITYKEGDVTVVNGQTLVFDGVNFAQVAQDKVSDNKAIIDTMSEYVSATYVVENGVTFDVISTAYAACEAVKSYKTVPTWLNKTMRNIRANGAGASEFNLAVIALAFDEIKQSHATDSGFDYSAAYPVASKAIKESTKASFSGVFDIIYSTEARESLKSMHLSVFDRKTGDYSDFWRGAAKSEVVIDATGFSPLQNYERLLYQKGGDYSSGIAIEDFAAVMPDVDVAGDDNWAFSTDGLRVIHKDDYFTGTLEEFNQRTQGDVSGITDGRVRAKVLRQIASVQDKLVKVDVSNIDFDIRSPYVQKEQVHAFLTQFVDPSIRMAEDGKFKYAGTSETKFAKGSIQAIAAARLVNYLNNGSFSSGKSAKEDPELDAAIREELAKFINNANLQFNAYVRSNKAFLKEVDAKINTPKTMRFPDAEGAGKLNIDGMSDKITPHEYQSDYVRQQARHMGGVLAYDVGLGKTLTALATVKHLQNIGAKKKTIFVVPNTTLTNWRKEVNQAYTNADDCLFVGMREGKDGKTEVKSSEYAKDLALLRDNQYRKIFMTLEAFEKIPMTDDTLNEYVERYLPSVEDIYNTTGTTDKEQLSVESVQLKLKQGISSKMDASVPFIESMGIDSIVMDEAHVFKNSRQGKVDAGGSVQFLSLPSTSSRGTNAQIKTWYIRGQNMPKGDGVLALTATPITNSPLEIYSMLVLTHGETKLQEMLGGIKSSSGFLQAFCNIEPKEFTNIHNESVQKSAFTGLKNAALLRKLFGDIAKVKTAQDEDVADLVNLPDAQEFNQNIEMSDDIKQILTDSIAENKKAKEAVKADKSSGNAPDKDDALKASAFYFINRVSRAVIDKDMYDEVTRYEISDTKAAKAVIDEFNSKGFKEERSRPSPNTPEDAIVGWKKVASKEDDGESVEICIIRVTAWLDGKTIVIDTDEYDMQSKFLAIGEKKNLSMGVSLSPKMAALVANVSTERANPKASGGKCKQVIFCDFLGMHKKIKMALVEHCGISASKISIMNAVEVDDAGLMQDIQDGFNAEGDENRFEIIIANKKAEVGINLQKGSQALHHLTTGWTPDSGQQRNGRVLRQGNYVKSVAIYHYHANGTFDEYKKQLVSTKSDWIMDLLRGTGDKVAIDGQLSKEDMEVLAGFVGDEQAMAQAKQNMMAQKASGERRDAVKGIDNATRIYEVSKKETVRYKDFINYVLVRATEAFKVQDEITKTQQRLAGIEAKEVKEQAPIDRLKAKIQSSEFLFNKLSTPIVESLGEEFNASKIGVSYGYDGKLRVNNWTGAQQYKDRLASDEIKMTALYVEWSDMMDSHTGIMDDAVSKAVETGKKQGIDEALVRGFFDGKAVRAGDEIIGRGAVFDLSVDGAPIYAVVSSVQDGLLQYTSMDGSERSLRDYGDKKHIKPNTGDYDAAVRTLIDSEKARLEALNWLENKGDVAIHVLVPQVRQGLGRSIAVSFDSLGYRLDCEISRIMRGSNMSSPLIEAVKVIHAKAGVTYANRSPYTEDFGLLIEGVEVSDIKVVCDIMAFACARGIEIDGDDIREFNISYLSREDGAAVAEQLMAIGAAKGFDANAWVAGNAELFGKQKNIPALFNAMYTDTLNHIGQIKSAAFLSVSMSAAGDIERILTGLGCWDAFSAARSVVPDAGAGGVVNSDEVVYVCTAGNTYGAFNSFGRTVAGVCEIRVLAKELNLDVGFVGADGKSKNDDAVYQKAIKTGSVTGKNAWIMDKRLWDAMVEKYAVQLNKAGITAHEVK